MHYGAAPGKHPQKPALRFLSRIPREKTRIPIIAVQRLPEIVYLARKRERTRRIGTVEDSLYLLLLAAALGYLLLAFLGM